MITELLSLGVVSVAQFCVILFFAFLAIGAGYTAGAILAGKVLR